MGMAAAKKKQSGAAALQKRAGDNVAHPQGDNKA